LEDGRWKFGSAWAEFLDEWTRADCCIRGPLLFCLLLSFLLSRGAQDDQKSLVFSGVFAMVWIGEAVVTLQIKLLGGSMYVSLPLTASTEQFAHHQMQILLPSRMHNRVHALPACHRCAAERAESPYHRACSGVYRLDRVVAGCRREYLGRVGRGEEPGWYCGLPAFCILCRAGVFVLH